MKKLLLVIIIFYLSNFRVSAQLDSITSFTTIPCMGIIGQSYLLSIDPVPGATSYIWTVDVLSPADIIFDGNIPPYNTSSNSVMMTIVIAQPYYVVCVTAFSSCCSSNTFCDTILGEFEPIFFSPSNSANV